MADLYNTLSELCSQKGVTGYRMCKDLGLALSTMTDLKKGRKKGFSAEIAAKIANYFGVSVDYLLGNTDIKKSPSNMEEENNIAKEIIEGLQKGGAMIAGKGKNGVDTIQVSDEEFEVMKNMLEAMRKAREK